MYFAVLYIPYNVTLFHYSSDQTSPSLRLCGRAQFSAYSIVLYTMHTVHTVHCFVFQDLDRAHREMNGLKSTVSAQGKEVERLQRENETLRSVYSDHQMIT